MIKTIVNFFKFPTGNCVRKEPTPISVLPLGQNIKIRLEKHGIESVEDLEIKMDSLHLIRGFGDKSVDRIKKAFDTYNNK